VGVILCIVAAFMALGFAQVGVVSTASILAFAVGVGIPAAAGVSLLLGAKPRSGQRRSTQAQLRRQTLDAEVLRLAGQRDGKITVVEVVTEMALSSGEASEILDAFARRSVADIQVTDSGVLVYDFRELRLLGEKGSAKDVLE
jgi:hypothetical protein